MHGESWKTLGKGLATGRKILLVFQGWIQQLSLAWPQSLGSRIPSAGGVTLSEEGQPTPPHGWPGV